MKGFGCTPNSLVDYFYSPVILTKNTILELFSEFTLKKSSFIREVTLFATGRIQLTALLIHSYVIRKRRLSIAQLEAFQ